MNDRLAELGTNGGPTRRPRDTRPPGGPARRSARSAPPARLLAGVVVAVAMGLGLPAGAGAAATATFNPGTGTLTVIGDALDDTIEIGRDAAGGILVNGGAVPISGGTPTVANTALIQVFGQGGNDVISLNEASGPLPRAQLFGGTGDDVLTGGSAADQLFGQAGNDTLLGKGGADFLFGGQDNDTLTGGAGDDQVFGESGDDRMVWNPGDGTDLDEGGAGTDTVEVNGDNGAESFTATANGERVRFDRLDPAPFALDIGTAEKLVVNANGGDDRFSATGNLAALIQISVDGGAGSDTLLGSNGADVLRGGAGNDLLDGQQGNDVIDLGAGADVFQWDPGDGSDVIEGQDGTDVLRFNGSAGNETFDVSANGQRVRFARDLGNIVMDLAGVERLEVNALGGTDAITVHSLAGTEATEVALDLAGTLGGSTGDGQADTVNVNATAGDDAIVVRGSGSGFMVTGLAARVQVSNVEGANDQLVVQALDGNDTVTATALPAGVVKFAVYGGYGNDRLTGGEGVDAFQGGEGNDTLLGKGGADFLYGGGGDDTLTGGTGDDHILGDVGNDRMVWNPGDGTDLNEGGDGADTVEVNGGSDAEAFTATANGTRVRFDRLSPAPFALDIGTAEDLVLNANGGDDSFAATGNLAALIRITVEGGAGDDTLLGSNGADVLRGGAGNDFLDGQQGNDQLVGGAGVDVFQWGPGDGSDVVEGDGGADTLRFNGSNIGELIDVAANGPRVRFARNVANIVLDVDGVERLEFNALGGADTITVNSLAGTDADVVALDLAGTLGGATGDGQRDDVVVSATSRGDRLTIAQDAGAVTVAGVGARVEIRHAEAALDFVRVNGQDGNDTVTAQTLPAGLINLILDGSAGNDRLTGSAGNDTLDGGAGTDTLDGGAGTDTGLNGETLINIP